MTIHRVNASEKSVWASFIHVSEAYGIYCSFGAVEEWTRSRDTHCDFATPVEAEGLSESHPYFSFKSKMQTMKRFIEKTNCGNVFKYSLDMMFL